MNKETVKKQQHTLQGSARSKVGKKIGTPIAKKVCELKEIEKAVTTPAVHPIDTLLVNQLENILQGEQELRSRYSTLDSTPEVRIAFSRELSRLSDRADRLSRLINAMGCYGCGEPTSLAAA